MSEDASSGGFPESEGQGIRGHLRLVCGPDSRGLPSLREQSFRAPIHLSKPHLDAGTLVVNVVNPTAGLLQDDRIHQDAYVEKRTSRSGSKRDAACIRPTLPSWTRSLIGKP